MKVKTYVKFENTLNQCQFLPSIVRATYDSFSDRLTYFIEFLFT